MKNITKTLLTITFAFLFGIQTQAQKDKNNSKHIVSEFRIDNSTITVSGGNVIFSDNSQINLNALINDNNNSFLNVALELVGKDIKGNKWIVSAPAKLNEKTGYYEATTKVNATYDNPFIAGEVNCIVTDPISGRTITSVTFIIISSQNKVAIFINGHKSPVKFGQCWVFSKSTGGNGNIVCLDELSVTQTYSEDPKTHYDNLDIVLQINDCFQARTGVLESLLTWGEATMSATVTVEYENGKTETKTIQAKFDSEKGSHFLTDQFAGGHIRTPRITKIELNITNTCNEVFTLETEYQSGYTEPTSNFHVWTEIWSIQQKTKAVDVCDVKYKAEKTTININDEKEIISIYNTVTFKENSDIPASVKAIVEMVNCKNEAVYIAVAMKSDEKEPWFWSSSQAIYQKTDCPLTFVGIKYIALSPCGEEINGEAIIPEGKLNKPRTGMRIFVAKLNFSTTSEDIIK